MAILNIFKKKKIEPVKPKISQELKKEINPEKPAESKILKAKKEKKTGESFRFLKNPHITEKATDLMERNQYVFKVFPRANKIEVKKAIKDNYGVDVVSIKIINIPQKKMKLGKIQGIKAGYKKAIVRIKEGQKIEVLSR